MMDATTCWAVQNAVLSVFHAVDALAWDEVRAAIADEITTDYSSLFGGEAVTQPADQLLEAWRGLLPGFDATQHLLGPLSIEAHATGACVRCQVRGYHHIEGTSGGDLWMVAGNYEMLMKNEGQRWLLSRLTLHTAYQEGNLTLPAEAQRRIADGKER